MNKHLLILIAFTLVLGLADPAYGQTDTSNPVITKQPSQPLDSSAVTPDSLATLSRIEADSAAVLASLIMNDSLKTADSVRAAELVQLLLAEGNQDSEERLELSAELNILEMRDSLFKLARRHTIDSLKEAGFGARVMLGEDSIFSIYRGVGGFSKEERAAAIAARLLTLAESEDEIVVDSKISGLKVVNLSPDGSTVTFNDGTLLILNAKDSDWEDLMAAELAVLIRDRIERSVIEYRKGFSVIDFIIEILLAILVIVILVFAIRMINRSIQATNIKLESLEGTFFTGFSFRGYELVNGHRQVTLLIAALRLIRMAVLVFLFYISIPILLSIFPWTRGWSEKLFGYILNPLGDIGMAVINFIPNMIIIVIVFFLVKSLVKFLKFITVEIELGNMTFPGFYPDWAKPTFNILRVLLYAYAFVVIFQYLPGSESKVFQGVTVFLGVLFSLGSSSAIANMIAGVVITYMRPFRIGDVIKIGDITGIVLQKTLLVTRLKTPKNEEITIPNSNVLNNHTTNYSFLAKQEDSPGLVLHTGVTIGYDVDWRLVHELLIGAARKTDLVNLEIDPYVLQTSLDDFYVAYQINCYSKHTEQMPKIYSDLHSNIQDAFNESSIEILSPHYRAGRDGSDLTIPPQYKEKR